jgi:hypothetical protein
LTVNTHNGRVGSTTTTSDDPTTRVAMVGEVSAACNVGPPISEPEATLSNHNTGGGARNTAPSISDRSYTFSGSNIAAPGVPVANADKTCAK